MIIQWIVNGLSTLANYTIFPAYNQMKTASANVGQELIKKYPDKAFQIFWSYNYYSVIFGEFMERNRIFTKQSTILTLPIENEYLAKCFYYEIEVNGSKEYLMYFENGNSITTSINSVPGTIYIKKTPECTFCNFTNNYSCENGVIKSSAKFINVIYSNERTKTPLTLKLDQSYFCVANEILSAAHVLLLLKTAYESSKFVFDLTYELKIMDGKFNLIVLKSDQYIEIDNSDLGYKIISINSDINSKQKLIIK
jgi:hypothetical protein